MNTIVDTTPALEEYCLCPDCFSRLRRTDQTLACDVCQTPFEIDGGIAILLPTQTSERDTRYRDSYERLAADDLETPLEADRTYRHGELAEFIGDVRGLRVLDVGSSNATYLRDLGAEFTVALDIAQTFLRAIPPAPGLQRICADAERLPFKQGAFDVIVLSDVLEHVLDDVAVVRRLEQVCDGNTRVIVHVPWDEDISVYRDSEYEFAHLRTFTTFGFARLFNNFFIRRARDTHPNLTDPIVFKIAERLPGRLEGLLGYAYFYTRLAEWEARWRERWIAELPRRGRFLLTVYPPTFRMFELQLVHGSTPAQLRAVHSRLREKMKLVIRRRKGGG